MALPPTDLPIEAHVDAVLDALGTTGHAVLAAEPGAGKTTVVPLRLLEAAWLDGTIVVLEPRRVAARAAARRMAAMLGEAPGDTVGWVTRDDRCIGPHTRIEIVTEGVLTARMAEDPALRGVAVVVFDEFHERSLPGDTGLALALHARRELALTARLLVMSATLDTDRVAALLDPVTPAPVIEAPGRAHPVEIRWRPRNRKTPLVDAMARAIGEALRTTDGDVLAFLPGVGEIVGLTRRLEAEYGTDGPAVLPLHGSLPAADQDAALRAGARRRVVLATDVAESSVTVDGVTAVVDSGLVRSPRHDPRTTMTALTVGPVSRASADQRAGRAGRLGPGVAIRLWSKVEHGARDPHRTPQIESVDLASLVLDLARRGITDPAEVPFLDPPPDPAWVDARRVLESLDAVDQHGAATALGERMAAVPAHPRLARGVVAGRHRWLGCVLAALLEDRDVLRGRPGDLPADLAIRVELVVDPDAGHPDVDGRAVRQARERARAMARRFDVAEAPIDPADIGAALLAGFTDRVARARRRAAGGFTLADGRTVTVRRGDPLQTAAGLVVVDLGVRPRNPTVARAARLEARLDHLVLGTPDLDRTVNEIAAQWGVAPMSGGVHPGLGTRNALLSLGDGAYLEVVGPDPAQPAPAGPRPFGIDDLEEARLVTWAAGVPDITAWLRWCRDRGVDPGEAFAMHRERPDGRRVDWTLTAPPADGDGVLPFLIEWDGPSPADTAPSGCALFGFTLCHRDPAIGSRLAEYAVPYTVESGPPEIRATLLTPAGMIELSSRHQEWPQE